MLEIHDYLPGRVQSVGMQDIVFHVDRQVAVCGVEVGTSVVGEGKSGWKGWRGGVLTFKNRGKHVVSHPR